MNNNVFSDRESSPSSVTVATNNRSTNWNHEEDSQLCRSWLSVSQDPITGIDQRGATMWQRIRLHYHENIGTGFAERTVHSLTSRWGQIQLKVSKYCGAVSQIERRKRSGANILNMVRIKMQRQNHLWNPHVNFT